MDLDLPMSPKGNFSHVNQVQLEKRSSEAGLVHGPSGFIRVRTPLKSRFTESSQTLTSDTAAALRGGSIDRPRQVPDSVRQVILILSPVHGCDAEQHAANHDRRRHT